MQDDESMIQAASEADEDKSKGGSFKYWNPLETLAHIIIIHCYID
jgi:hypothetical protein